MLVQSPKNGKACTTDRTLCIGCDNGAARVSVWMIQRPWLGCFGLQHCHHKADLILAEGGHPVRGRSTSMTVSCGFFLYLKIRISRPPQRLDHMGWTLPLYSTGSKGEGKLENPAPD